MSYYLTYICIQITLTVSDCRSNIPWSTQVFQVTTKWFFSCIRQHPSFANQTGWWIHSFTINISYQQLDWRIEIFRPLENCPYQFYTKIHQPNRAERQSSDISSSSFIKSVQNINFTASNNRLYWNEAGIQQTPIWILQKLLNWNHSLEIIWWYQTNYETPSVHSSCFYRLFKGF